MTTFRALRRTWFGAVADAWANRRNFWSQSLVMILNDLMWVVFWVIFFDRLGEVRGWELRDVLVLQAILTTAAGITLGLFNNSRQLGRLIADGQLDEALALPVPPLPYLLVRRIEPINIGDLAFGIGMFAVMGEPTPLRTLAFVIAVVISAITLTAFLVLAASTAFVGGRSDGSELGFHSMLLFASYPVDVFGGVMKVLLFTVIPAGFITAVPTRFVRDLEPELVLAAAGVAVLLTALATFAFSAGLRRYTSGALWTAG